LFEDALSRAADQIRAATSAQKDPLERLKVAVSCSSSCPRPDPTARRPLFTDFAPQLLISHPTEVKVAHAPLVALFGELMEDAGGGRELRKDANPGGWPANDDADHHVHRPVQRRPDRKNVHTPITGDEVWTFCSQGFARH